MKRSRALSHTGWSAQILDYPASSFYGNLLLRQIYRANALVDLVDDRTFAFGKETVEVACGVTTAALQAFAGSAESPCL
jgi:hypothetical protein